MSSDKRNKILENVIYLVLWAMVFIAPVVSFAFREEAFSWNRVFEMWISIIPLLAIFLVHNFFVSKYFFVKGKRWLYLLLAIVLLAVHPGISIATHGEVPWALCLERPVSPRPSEGLPPGPPPDMVHPRLEGRGPQAGQPIDLVAVAKVALAVLTLVLNIIIKWLFKSKAMEDRMLEMEKVLLQGRLQQLRHQINPHFFMNTLNNIHALVDIDPEKAKSTIIELSRLMRYVLYDSSDGILPVDKEISFLEKYLSIMSLRYSDNVKISADFDAGDKTARIPSLLLVTFLENAFKHGITYTKESVLETSLRVASGRILFTCFNTKGAEKGDESTGIGLANACKRLDLIYGSDYKLDIAEDEESYKVTLSLPSEPAIQQ
ncbi:MAG: histidine kinase [Bacteroidales bacterium]|jgi:hypothetical protein|nr:histidine kinase [Bacteroidales bacterium]